MDPLTYHRIYLQILADLHLEQYATQAQVDEQLSQAAAGGDADMMASLSNRMTACKADLFKPEGRVSCLTGQVKRVKERRHSTAVELGNKIFRDQKALQAWL